MKNSWNVQYVQLSLAAGLHKQLDFWTGLSKLDACGNAEE